MNPALALLSGVLLVLVHPRADLWWLSPVALVPLLLACQREQRPRRRLLLGLAAGTVYWFGVCYWIQQVLAEHGGLEGAGSWAVFMLFCLAKAAHLAVFAWLAGYFLDRPWGVPAAAALWAGLERTHGPLGFAWLNLGEAGLEWAPLVRLAPLVGVYGMSFVLALANASLAVRRPRALLWLLVLPAVLLLPALPEAEEGREEAVVVQPNISEDAYSWNTAATDRLVNRLVLMSLEESSRSSRPPRYVIWPEMPAPLYYYDDARFREQATIVARTGRAPLLFGTVAFTREGAPLNSVLMLGPDGAPVERYDKMTLVPFGEYVPAFFGFVNRITKEAGDFVPGSRRVLFPSDGRQAGVFICYESVFPYNVRRFVDDGAEVLFNLSNDGYFGDTAARPQHLRMVRTRAAENARWILRATNDGITAAIDPAGRIVERLPARQEASARLRFSFEQRRTPYTRLGDWFAWSCLVAGAGAAFAGAVGGRASRAV